jgi:alkanesulfonate monooxygenase SsuD/methylene tetrahydromethanopterin reductase-like flavin-dependent oxidoreductase (luciferase family)
MQPKPVQRPHPPLIMGGLAGPRSASLAATYADEYNTVFATAEEVRERKARLDAACERARRSPLPFSLMTGVILGGDDAEVQARVRRVAEIRGDASMIETTPNGWIVGTIEQAVERLAELRDAGVSRVMCQHLAHDDLEAVAQLGETARALSGTR